MSRLDFAWEKPFDLLLTAALAAKLAGLGCADETIKAGLRRAFGDYYCGFHDGVSEFRADREADLIIAGVRAALATIDQPGKGTKA